MPRFLLPCLLAALLLPAAALAGEAQFQVGGIALGGWDPVSYFADGAAARGKSRYRLEYNGATWHFASESHRDRFAANPGRYAPRYGGFCAYAVSQGQLVPVDPHAWTIHRDRLYLNYSTRVRAAWRADLEHHLELADENWQKLKDFTRPLEATAE